MKRTAILIFSLLFVADLISAQTNELTYQGKLVAGGSVANTPHDFEFRLCAAADACTPPLDVKQRLAVEVSNGVFTVKLDFDSAQFNGADRWLEIAVRPAGGGTFAALSPRQRITSTPYSVKSLSSDVAMNSLGLNGLPANQYVVTTDSRMSDDRNPLPNSANYIQNNPAMQQSPSSFNISGNGTAGGTIAGNIVNAETQFNLNGARILSVPGSNNLFAGVAAGLSNTGGVNGTFFGRAAGFGNTDGNNNSFFGAAAGNTNAKGSQNTLIGAFAFTGADNPSNATALGYRAFVNQNNSLILGGINGVNGCSPPECDSVKVGIGTPAPTERLHVVGNSLFAGQLTATGPLATANSLTVGGVAIVAAGPSQGPGANETITVSTSYVRFTSPGSGPLAIINGATTPGQVLILEGPSEGFVSVITSAGGNIRLAVAAGPVVQLGLRDTAVLVWNGSFWLEITRSINN